MRKKITMLILSCDKFSDLWDGHVKQLEKHWPDRDMKTYIVTDKPTDKSYENVEVIAAGENAEWSDRLLYALSQINTEYVFITLDDYFLIEDVSTDGMKKLLEMMDAQHFDYVRLFKRPTSATGRPVDGYPGVFYVDSSQPYSVNLYSGIWKKDFLKACVERPLNPWQFEVSLPQMACTYGAECAVSNKQDFVILDVVRKGKLLHNSYYYFKRHPGIYTGSREVNSWGYEFRLGVKTLVRRYTPPVVYNAIKRVMRRFGYQFFSE